jgi:hypothetical protein
MKKSLVITLLVWLAQVQALPTIAMPDLIMEKTSHTEVPVTNGINSSVLLPVTIKTTLAKFSADIRGALVNSGQFRVIDIPNLKVNNLANLQSVLGQLKADPANTTVTLATDTNSSNAANLAEAAKDLANELIKSGKLDQCDSYTLVESNAAEANQREVSQALLSELANAKDFDGKYHLINLTSTTTDTIIPQCRIKLMLTTTDQLTTNGIANNQHLISLQLIKDSKQAILWQKTSQLNSITKYYLVGIINEITEGEDSFPLKNTVNLTKQYYVEVAATFKLVRAKDNALMAAFSTTGRAKDVKIVSLDNMVNTTWHHNVGQLVSEASKDLANNVVSTMLAQFSYTLKTEDQTESIKKPEVVTDVKVYN